MDNMEGMGQFPDNYFDLAIIDPPYGLGNRLIDGGNKGEMGSLRKLNDYKVGKWDKKPNKQYFDELFRVSINQIIWGGNYFIDYLFSTDGLIIWDKMNGDNCLTDAEIAWKNMEGTTRIFRMHHFSKGYEKKIHPTQKPIKLYRWILKKYGQAGWKILDTHVGSGSSLIACEREGFQYVGFEIDPDYYKAANDRIKRERNILTLDLQ